MENKKSGSNEHWLDENEELVGVYGVKDKSHTLHGLGFIVRYRQNKETDVAAITEQV